MLGTPICLVSGLVWSRSLDDAGDSGNVRWKMSLEISTFAVVDRYCCVESMRPSQMKVRGELGSNSQRVVWKCFFADEMENVF
jgi:hypothetical protein